MKKAILIGGNGFLGSYVLAELLEKGIEVYAIEHHKTIAKHAAINVIQGGIRQLSARVIDQISPEAIFHCARPTLPGLRRFGRHVAAYLAKSANYTLLEELELSKSKPRLLFASGSLMYGSSDSPVDENSPLNPTSYARQYVKGEIPFLKAIRDQELPVALLRFPWLLGYGSWFRWFFVDKIREFGFAPRYTNKMAGMMILDAGDAAKLMVEAAGSELQGIINITAPNVLGHKEFCILVNEVFETGNEHNQKQMIVRLDKETKEAFDSNIIMTTVNHAWTKGFNYTSVKDSLVRIKKEAGF